MPRYDVPKAAPEPLRQVQLLLNSEDQENKVDWLPDWLAERLVADHGDRAEALAHALNRRAPMTVRANLLVGDRDEATANGLTANGLTLRHEDRKASRRLPIQMGSCELRELCGLCAGASAVGRRTGDAIG